MNSKEQIERVRKIVKQGDCDLSCTGCPLQTVDEQRVCGLDISFAATRTIAKGWLAENEHKRGQLQPIATVPKDGGDILLSKVTDKRVLVAQCFYSMEDGRFIAYNPSSFLLSEATHWMPLPEVPK